MTTRLIKTAARHWDLFDGWCMSKQIDPFELPPVRFNSLIYFWATQMLDENERASFDAKLFMPPPGEIAEDGPWTPEAEMASFHALAASLNIAPVKTDTG